jgi:hypothetical protein
MQQLHSEIRDPAPVRFGGVQDSLQVYVPTTADIALNRLVEELVHETAFDFAEILQSNALVGREPQCERTSSHLTSLGSTTRDANMPI